jgi:integrase
VALRRQEGARGQTIRREIQALRRGLEAARKRGRLHRVLADWPEVRSDPAHEGKRGKLIPPGILSRWLGELEGDAQDQALVALLTGLRSQELRRLRWEWVEPTDSGPTPAILRLPAGSTKSRQERVVGLPAAVLEVLERKAQAAQGGPLLPGEHKTAYRLASKRAKWHRTITLRDLRHTHATISAHATGDAAGTQAALGHSDLATTQRYLSATVDRAAGAAAAVAQALNWHTPPGTAAGRGANNPGSKWSGRQDSNLRPSAPEANDPLLAHVAACAWCRAMAAECMSLHEGSEAHMAQGLAQAAPEQARRVKTTAA